MSVNGKLKIGVYWASSCGGCDIALLEIGTHLLELIEAADFLFWPCAIDFKYADVARYPDGALDLCLFNGGVRNSEQEAMARLLRRKSKVLVAFGACARGGGVPALANLTTKRAILSAVYRESPSLDNPTDIEPQTEHPAGPEKLRLPEFYPAVLRLQDVVPVDFELAGCPPRAEQIWEFIGTLTQRSGAAPAEAASAADPKTVCNECPREKRQKRIEQFQRHHQFRAEPGWCLLEQGIVCLGPATRGGCGARCLKADMRCEGCYGAPEGVPDQGAAMTGAISTMLDAATEERARELTGQIADPTGTFYRFTLSSSLMKARRQQESTP